MAMDKAQFHQALREAAGAEFSHIPSEAEIDHNFSDDFLDDLEPFLYTKKRRFSALQRIAAVLLCVGFVAALAGTADALQDRVFSPIATLLSLGKFKQGFNGNIYEGDIGEYYVYQGGEITIPYGIYNSEGQGVEIQLFLNGEPQPFKTEQDETYRYTHILYPLKSRTLQELTFTPVAGQKGDVLQLCVSLQGFASDYNLEYSCGAWTSIWLVYEENPGEFWEPASEFTSESFTFRQEAGYRTSPRIDLAVNNSYGWKVAVDASQHVTLTAKLGGDFPSGKYRLIFLVNHKPVLIDGKTYIPLELEAGQYERYIETTIKLPQDTIERCVHVILLPERQPGDGMTLPYSPFSGSHQKVYCQN